MISQFRRYTDSWIARGFFLLMAVSFVGWGISGEVVNFFGPPSWVAKVAGQTIEAPVFQAEYQRAIAQQSANLPSGQQMSADQRQMVGQQVLQRMIDQAAIGLELKTLHVVTPDDAVAAAARAMPAFKGQDGKFSKPLFDAVLRNNGFTEARFLSELRADIAQRQVLGAIDSGVAAPAAEVMPLFTAEFEKRSADMATFPISAAPEPPDPTDAALHRWYDNHPDSYVTPEYRRIKAIELSPQSLASDITITDAELQTAYNEHKSEYVTPDKRSAEVISIGDQAKAQALAEKWRGGADWAAMQAAAQADGGAAITQDDAPEVEYPDPDLAKAVFSASADKVSDPVKGALGWFIVKVTQIADGGTVPFDAVKDKLHAQVLAAKAADMMYDRANKLDQLLGNGGGLDNLPGDLGVIGVSGTLDRQGETQQDQPAPIPGSPELKAAIIAAAFQAHVGDPPNLTEVQTPSVGGSAYYALVVESVIPPGKKPFDAVQTQVTDDWKQDQRRRVEDKAATAMMTAVQSGQSFSDAATVAGVTPHLSGLVTRSEPTSEMPADLQSVLFGLKKGEATMVQTSDGFVVAQLVEVVKPDAAADKTTYDQARAAITRSIGGDLASVFVEALRQRANPQTNQTVFNSVVQPQ